MVRETYELEVLLSVVAVLEVFVGGVREGVVSYCCRGCDGTLLVCATNCN